MIRIIKKFFLVMSGLFLFCLTSCAMVSSSFTPEEYTINCYPKESSDKVDYLARKPTRSAVRIGFLSLGGNNFSGFDDLVKKAKKEAATLGGDFILAEKNGVNKQDFYSPGYSNYQANANASYDSSSGQSSSKAVGYSVGPSVSTVDFPWGVFSVWVYRPSKLGLEFDENNYVTGFHLNSDAEEVGIKLGDQLIGVDGHDVRDQSSVSHLMNIRPGSKVELTLRRQQKKVVYSITAIPNV